jgi:PAS domain S-box-containing protein
MDRNITGDKIAVYLNALSKAADSDDLTYIKAIADTAPYPVCIFDFKRSKYLLRNKAHEELENKLVKNQSLQDMPFLIDNEAPYSIFQENIHKATVPFVEEHEYNDLEGHKLVYEIYGFPIISKAENQHFVILHYQNITIETNSRQEVAEYRKTLQDLFTNLPGMVFRCLNETNWTVEFASAGAKALTGYSSEELINNTKIKYGDLIHPDDRQMVWNIIQEAVKRKRHYDIQYRIITKKGKIKWVAERGLGTFDKHDQIVSIEGFISDISEGKVAELNLKRELEISEAIARISMELLKDTVTPIQVSKMVQDYVKDFTGSKISLIYTPDQGGNTFTLFNHEHEEEIITIHPADYPQEHTEFINKLIETSGSLIQNEPSTIILPGFINNEVEVSKLLSVPAYTNNKLSGLLILLNAIEDYSEEDIAVGQRFINMFALGIYRLRAEETLQDAKSKAEESDRLKSLFLSNMSHEIRTPMNAIVGFAEMLQDSDLNRDQKNKFLDVIIKSGDNLLRLINDIIDISKIEAGQLKFDYSDCLVNEMISDLETYFKQEMVRLRKSHLNLFVQLGHPENDFTLFTDCSD